MNEKDRLLLDEIVYPKIADAETGEFLVPVVIQHAQSLRVLTLAFMNKIAVDRTKDGEVHLYSRSRKEQWHKGATSGNFLKVVKIELGCHKDSVLIQVEPQGPACHMGTNSCFDKHYDDE